MANPFVHIELSTDDVAKAKKFYRGVFDWKLADMPMGPDMVYTMIDVGKGVGAIHFT
ncbi:MAG: VOC family protein [bacterium]|nr:VOC family protein [bacterium]